MKKSLLAVAAISAAISTGSAFAADLPSHKAPILPPPPPPPLWTGFYVGVNGGGHFGGDNSVNIATAPIYANPNVGDPQWSLDSVLSAAIGASGRYGVDKGGFIGGGQIGYNYQFSPNFVAGIEADIQGVTGSGSANGATAVGIPSPSWFLPGVASTALTTSKSMDYLGTVRGRLGYLVTPTLLVYATGGLAYGGVNSNTSILQNISGPSLDPRVAIPYLSHGSFSDTRVGWTVGGGGEWMFAPNWSAKIEYLYYDLGTVTYGTSQLTNIMGAGMGALSGQAWHALAPRVSTRFDGHVVRAGLNYHFNLFGAAAPIVAKY